MPPLPFSRPPAGDFPSFVRALPHPFLSQRAHLHTPIRTYTCTHLHSPIHTHTHMYTPFVHTQMLRSLIGPMVTARYLCDFHRCPGALSAPLLLCIHHSTDINFSLFFPSRFLFLSSHTLILRLQPHGPLVIIFFVSTQLLKSPSPFPCPHRLSFVKFPLISPGRATTRT